MNSAEQSRPLEVSDIASEHNKEILKNPFKFLGLPDDAPIADVRSVYITKTRLYHPDMVNPSFNAAAFVQRYKPNDFVAMQQELEPLSSGKTTLYDHIQHILSTHQQSPEGEERRRQAIRAIQAAAHEKMVQLNTAYEAIKSRYSRREWNTIAGYTHTTFYNDSEEEFDQEVVLEGNGKLTIYPNSYEYWVPGAYLQFDWGPPHDHPWYDDEFRHAVVVKHMFVYMEMQEGRTQISPVLLQPFFSNFQLNEEQQALFRRLLFEKKTSEEIMMALDIQNDYKIDLIKNPKSWDYSNRFRRHTNEMLTLETAPEFHYDDVSVRLRSEGGKLILEDYVQTIFSEADVTLLATLAYGPLLTIG